MPSHFVFVAKEVAGGTCHQQCAEAILIDHVCLRRIAKPLCTSSPFMGPCSYLVTSRKEQCIMELRVNVGCASVAYMTCVSRSGWQRLTVAGREGGDNVDGENVVSLGA